MLDHIKIERLDATRVHITNSNGRGRSETFDFGGHRVAAFDFAILMDHFKRTMSRAYLEQAKDVLVAPVPWDSSEARQKRVALNNILKSR